LDPRNSFVSCQELQQRFPPERAFRSEARHNTISIIILPDQFYSRNA
jgi:hypothetical protein